ncbi:MAG: potassium channel family protein [Planctomycetota bacterium]
MRSVENLRFRDSHLGLFVCLSSIFLVYPHFVQTAYAKAGLDCLISLSIVFSLYRRGRSQRIFRSAYVAIGVIATIATCVSSFTPAVKPFLPSLYTVFFALSVLIHFRDLLSEGHVNGDTLLGAACTYILIGMLFASANVILLQLDPECFNLAEDGGEPIYQLTYFSIITLTTVGYGDLVPLSNATRMLAAFEAVIGQVFVAVVVGLLVGKHIALRSDKPNG